MEWTARVQDKGGRRFVAGITNLTPNTVFLQTAQPLSFRDVFEVTLFEHTVRAVVIFASSAPRGVVIWFESPESLKAQIRAVMAHVPIAASTPIDADAWREITNTEADLQTGRADDTPELGTPFQTSSSVAESEDLEAPWAEASVVLSQDSPIAPEVREAIRAASSPPRAESASGGPGRQDLARISLERAVPGSTPRGAPLSSPRSSPGSPAAPPSPPEASPPSSSSGAAAPPASPREAPAQTTPASRDTTDELDRSLVYALEDTQPTEAPKLDQNLPSLDRDGCTVRFSSAAMYRDQFDTHLTHGGLVVAADPVPVGTQRMLVLSVPSAPGYTVSARVVFNQPGVVGFMLDSFGLHRDRLRSMLG